MKFNGFGRAKVLSSSEIDKLFAWGFTNSRDRALFGICLHTGCRISEALATTTLDLNMGYITLKKRVTKGKKRTMMIPITDPLHFLYQLFSGVELIARRPFITGDILSPDPLGADGKGMFAICLKKKYK